MIPQNAIEADCLQAAAIPFRRRKRRLEFCLITSSAGRWIFPKGMIDPGDTGEEAALKEAYEEAGLHGSIVRGPLGYFTWEKQALGQVNSVAVYLMQVERVDVNWLESEWRDRRWVTLDQAIDLLESQELIDLLQTAADWLDRRPA